MRWVDNTKKKSELILYLCPLWHSLTGEVLCLTKDGGPPGWLIQGKNVIKWAVLLSWRTDPKVLIIYINRTHPEKAEKTNCKLKGWNDLTTLVREVSSWKLHPVDKRLLVMGFLDVFKNWNTQRKMTHRVNSRIIMNASLPIYWCWWILV